MVDLADKTKTLTLVFTLLIFYSFFSLPLAQTHDFNDSDHGWSSITDNGIITPLHVLNIMMSEWI